MGVGSYKDELTHQHQQRSWPGAAAATEAGTSTRQYHLLPRVALPLPYAPPIRHFQVQKRSIYSAHCPLSSS